VRRVGGRFGSKVFVYPEETVCLWAARRRGVAVRWTADRTEAFLTDAHGRHHVTHAEMAFVASHRIAVCASSPSPILVLTCRRFRRLCRPIFTRPFCQVSTISRPSTPRSAPFTRSGRAYRIAGRPEATYGDCRAASWHRSGGVAPKEFHQGFPHQTPVIMNYDNRDYHATLEAALQAADYNGFAGRKAERQGENFAVSDCTRSTSLRSKTAHGLSPFATRPRPPARQSRFRLTCPRTWAHAQDPRRLRG
jgi:aerobic carbon-monoxide dehydrogenase large subunit